MIEPSFLHDVAEYVDSRIAKVTLNESYDITDFQVKEVTGNMLALNYIIPAADVSLVTKMELKDENDTVLTSDDVNVPITSDALMLQTIEVEEVTT